MKTEQEVIGIINEYEKNNPTICGTDTLIKFIQWYDIKTQSTNNIARTSMEWGYKAHEEGKNIQQAKEEFEELIRVK